MFSYFLLKDSEHEGMLIKRNDINRQEFYFNNETKRWTPIAILMNYFWIESDTFEMYDKISEQQAKELLK